MYKLFFCDYFSHDRHSSSHSKRKSAPIHYRIQPKQFNVYLTVSLISLSLLLQIAVGIGLIFKGKLDRKGKSEDSQAKKIDAYVVVPVFLVTVINVFIAITGDCVDGI